VKNRAIDARITLARDIVTTITTTDNGGKSFCIQRCYVKIMWAMCNW